MGRGRGFCGLFAVVVSALVLVGGSAGADVPAAKPQRGGELIVVAAASPTQMDPALVSTVGAGDYQRRLFTEPLLSELTKTGEVTGVLMESFKSTDNVVWTLKLRPNVKFSDGTPLNAAAVKAFWDRIADPALRSVAAPAARVMQSVEVVDGLTLRVTLITANSQFPRHIATTALTWVTSPTAWAQVGAAGFATKPIASGPFMVESYQRDVQLTVVRNPLYYGKAPYLDKVTVRYVPNPTQRLNTLRAGDADLAVFTDPDVGPKLKDAGFATVTAQPSGGQQIQFNTARAPFDDVKARQAITLALDPDKLNQAVFAGGAEPVHNIFQSTSPFHDPKLDQAKANAKKAQQLFDELAKVNGGKPLEFTLLTIPSTYGQTAAYVQATLVPFDNVKVNLEELQQSAYVARLATTNWQAAMFTIFFLDPSSSGVSFQTNAQQNFTKYSNPVVDAAYNTMNTAQDLKDRKAAFKTVQESLRRDVPVKFLYRLTTTYSFKKSKVHIGDNTQSTSFGHFPISRVWLSSE